MGRSPVTTLAMPLTDGEVLLRLPCDSDIDRIYAYGQDPQIEEAPWLPIPVPCPRDVASRLVEEFHQGWHGHGRFGLTFVITTPPAADLFGVVHLFCDDSDVGEIDYGVAPQHRRRGLATRAVKLVSAWAFVQLGFGRLEICITARDIHGLASQRVAEKAGFVYEGIRRSRVLATGAEFEDRLYALVAPSVPEAGPPNAASPYVVATCDCYRSCVRNQATYSASADSSVKAGAKPSSARARVRSSAAC